MQASTIFLCGVAMAFTLAARPGGAQPAPIFGAPASAATLAGARGGSASLSASATLGGAVSGNRATELVTGANTIEGTAFAGAAGIPIVIQNTGANVLIQNATVIQLQFK